MKRDRRNFLEGPSAGAVTLMFGQLANAADGPAAKTPLPAPRRDALRPGWSDTGLRRLNG